MEACNLLVSSCVEREAKIDDAGMWKMLAEDQFAKVSIIGDKDPVLGDGDGENLIVW